MAVSNTNNTCFEMKIFPPKPVADHDWLKNSIIWGFSINEYAAQLNYDIHIFL